MDADTYPRRDVQQWLATTVCMKINAERDAGLADKFGVRAFPTLVLMEPSGTVLYTTRASRLRGSEQRVLRLHSTAGPVVDHL